MLKSPSLVIRQAAESGGQDLPGMSERGQQKQYNNATAEFPNWGSTKSMHLLPRWEILTQVPADVNVEVDGVVAVVHQVAAAHFD